MITHTITLHVEPKTTRHQQMHRFDGELGSDRHKEYIFDRALRHCKFEIGESVLYKRNRYEIINIEHDFHRCMWDGLTPLFIDIWDGDKVLTTVHHGVLSRRRK